MTDNLDQISYDNTTPVDVSNVSSPTRPNDKAHNENTPAGQRIQYFMLDSVVSTVPEAFKYAFLSMIIACVAAIIIFGFSHGWANVHTLFPLQITNSLIGTAIFTLPYIIAMIIATLISHKRQSYKLNPHLSSSQPPHDDPIQAALIYPLVIGMPVDDYTNHNFLVRQRIIAVAFESLVSRGYITVKDNVLSLPDTHSTLSGLSGLEKSLFTLLRHICALQGTKTLSLSDLQDSFAQPIENKKLNKFMANVTDQLDEVDKSKNIISGFPLCNLLIYPLPFFIAYFLLEKHNIGWIIFGSLLVFALLWCFIYEPNNTLGFKGHAACKKWNPFVNYMRGNSHVWQNPENRIYAAAFALEYPNHTLADLIGIHLAVRAEETA